MQDILLEPLSLNQIELLQHIAKETFYETFSAANEESNMQVYLDQNLNLEQLKSEFLSPHSSFYLVRTENKLIGYCKLNFDQTNQELPKIKRVEVERIYLLQSYQGKKIGYFLMQNILEIAKKQNAAQIWLGVWEHNLKAIQFYQKFGFLIYGQQVFKLGADLQTDLLMRLDINL
jgi:ribosomal protein S18 acetylase RimI-like enzyme